MLSRPPVADGGAKQNGPVSRLARTGEEHYLANISSSQPVRITGTERNNSRV